MGYGFVCGPNGCEVREMPKRERRDYAHAGRALRERRREAGLTMGTVARMIGIKASRISAIEWGYDTTTSEEAAALEEIYGE